MAGISHEFGQDLSLSPSGDVATADSVIYSRQRVLRRLLTNPTVYDAAGNVLVPGDYMWEPDYGAGLPRYVGVKVDVDAMTALIRAQMFLEASVLQNPVPQIRVTPIANGMYVDIQYVEADSGLPATLNFPMTPNTINSTPQ